MKEALIGEYFKVCPAHSRDKIAFRLEFIDSRETVCFVRLYMGKIVLEDVNFNSIRIFDNVKDPIDVYEILMEYINCVDFAKQSIRDMLNIN